MLRGGTICVLGRRSSALFDQEMNDIGVVLLGGRMKSGSIASTLICFVNFGAS